MMKEKIKVGIYLFIKSLKRILSINNLNRLIKLSSLLFLVLVVPALLEQAPPAEQWQPEVKATFMIAALTFMIYFTNKR